jgi:aryl-alcohol dehydrogenase-like predicted oxidoreductase
VCADQEIAVCPYSPLAGGFLTGKYERVGDGTYDLDAPDDARSQLEDRFRRFYVSERGWHVLDEIRAIADEIDATPAQVALCWLMDQPEITCVPIVGARKPGQIDENVGAVPLSLSADHFDRIVDARYDEDGNRYRTAA